MYRVAVLGSGRIGYAAIYDFLRLGYDVIALDVSDASLKFVKEKMDVPVYKIDKDFQWMDKFKEDADAIVTALPWSISKTYVEKLLDNGYNVVDVTSIPIDEIPYLEKVASKSGSKAFLYGGVAPGMAQTLAGALYNELDDLDKLEIYVGGLPQDPSDKPLKTNVTWNPIGFLYQYIHTSRKVVDGEVIGLNPLDDVGCIKLPGEDEYEYFLTDGLMSLLITFTDVPNMAEYTLRYKGHLDEMKLLIKLGLLDLDAVEVGGCKVEPIKFTARVMDLNLSKDPRDKVLLAVYGWSGDIKSTYYSYVNYSDELGLTGMQIATGFNLSRYTHMFLKDLFNWTITLPEYIGMDKRLFKIYWDLMDEAGIKIYRIEERI